MERKPQIIPRLSSIFPKWYNEVQQTSTNCNEMQLKQVEVRKHTGGKSEMKETSQVIAAVKREVQLSEWQRQIQERRNPQIILRQIAKENLRVCISEVRCK